MTSGKGIDDLINTLTKKKLLKGFLTMAKISSWHFRHLLYVVWLKRLVKGGVHRQHRTPLATPTVKQELIPQDESDDEE